MANDSAGDSSVPHGAGPARTWWMRATVVTVLVLPTAVAAVYMWIMWDPELYLKRVPVAVANLDAGVSDDGQQQNLGADILGSLTDSGELDFHRVSATEAIRGLQETRYAFSIVIPRDFSQRVLSVTDPTPTPAKIKVYYNDFSGTLGTTVAASVIAQAQMEITKTIGTSYAKEVLVGLNQLGAGLHDAADGSGELHDGTVDLADGAAELSTGIGQAHAGVAELKGGTSQLSSGTVQLHSGTTQLGDGAIQIRNGITEIVDPLLGVLSRLGAQASSLKPLIAALSAASDPTVRDAAREMASLLSEIDAGNANGAAGQLVQLRDGISEIARQLTDPDSDYLGGINELVAGARELDSGAAELLDGVAQLDDGGKELATGAVQLQDGAAQLNVGLADGAAQAPVVDDIDASSTMFADPVSMDESNQQPAQRVIGGDRSHKQIDRGAAPVIIVLGTFLLALLAWLLMPAVRGSAAYASRWARTAIPVAKGAVGGIATGVGVALLALVSGAALGWHPASWLVMAAVAIVIGIAAAAMSQTVVVIFGRLYGTLITFALYMYGIFAFGGVFPPGTTPPFFRPFEVITPMTYAQRAILRAHLGLYDQMFWVSIGMLAAMAAGALLVSVFYRWWLDRRGYSQIEPTSADGSTVVPGALAGRA